MNYEMMVESIEKAILESQLENSGNHNYTGVAVCVRPETTNAAKTLGLTVGKCASHTGGDMVDRYVGRGCVPMQELALALADQTLTKGEKHLMSKFKNVTQADIEKIGVTKTVKICFRPSGSSADMIWATIYIAVCDTAPSRMFVKKSISAGLQALEAYVGQSAGKRRLFVNS